MRSCSSERQDQEPAIEQPAACGIALQRDVHLGLQICRAHSLSLTRLQLALKQDDRRGVLEAVDRLHDLDNRFSRFLQRLPASANDDPEAEAISRYIDEQSMAVAFARLALVSQVSGPDMISASRDGSDPGRPGNTNPGIRDEPDAPMAGQLQVSSKVLGLILALLTFAALAGSILLASRA